MLNKVIIDKTDTCISYALKRIGKFEEGKKYSLLHLDEIAIYENFDIDNIKIGDIIYWNKKAYIESLPMEITESGTIHNNPVLRNAHVAVIEKVDKINNIILYSDCSRTHHNGTPILSIFNIKDKRLPDLKVILK